MGKLLDMLPQIEAEARMRDILAYLGCVRLGCIVEVREDSAHLGTWVRHNDETKFLEYVAERESAPVFRTDGPWQHRLAPVAYIRSNIAKWITEQHPAIEARREAERQAEIDADPWREHAEMVAGVR